MSWRRWSSDSAEPELPLLESRPHAVARLKPALPLLESRPPDREESSLTCPAEIGDSGTTLVSGRKSMQDSLHAPSRRRPVRWRAALALLPLAGALFPLACGDDEVTPPGSGTTAQVQIQNGFAQLGTFRDAAGSEPALQLLDTPEFAAILNTLSLPSVPVTLTAPPGASRPVRALLRKLSESRPRLVQTAFGTWQRDPSNTGDPFPGWTLVDPGNPPDGFIFRFDLDDGIFVLDPGGAPIPLRGEFRILEIQIDDRGTPDPADDVPLGLVLEIAATAEAMGDPPVLVHLDFALEFDAAGELQSFHLGDPQASSPNDGGAAFLGPVLIAVSVESAPGSLTALVQIYDSSENFVVSLEVGLTGDVGSGLLEAASTAFGYGVTRDPTTPPWVIALEATNFRADPNGTGDLADIHGSIRRGHAELATLAGDTTEVPIDTDGDQIPDDSCLNVNVTFADTPNEPQNLCLALPGLRDLLGGGGGMPLLGATNMFPR